MLPWHIYSAVASAQIQILFLFPVVASLAVSFPDDIQIKRNPDRSSNKRSEENNGHKIWWDDWDWRRSLLRVSDFDL